MNRGTGLFDIPTRALRGAVKKQEKMIISARPIAFFADFGPMRALRWMLAVAVVAAVAVPGTADAARRARVVRTGAFDGVWSGLLSRVVAPSQWHLW
jgi:hypothetical protein